MTTLCIVTLSVLVFLAYFGLACVIGVICSGGSCDDDPQPSSYEPEIRTRREQ